MIEEKLAMITQQQQQQQQQQQSQQEDAPTNDPTAPRVSTKGSCSIADRIDYNIQYDFLDDEDPPHVVAVGRQIVGGQTIHGATLLPTHARCNKHNDSWACGYYIMSWMKAIIRAEIRVEWTEFSNNDDKRGMGKIFE
ncbi:hypothetical protein LR48_Vigan10g149900 [Vigna angularis]|uniref:Ubiquitin-like protease family profile domain-containing protein n=1 Tax=Phaseolus angularis TaxID=3914 RepID=A0A0L9VL38_PHAAN|nr:hypothetical protein LR48_Vigan10g149900 [Vigna angularis]